MSAVSLEKILELLKEFVHHSGKPLKVIISGALAMHYYDFPDRATSDLDAEVEGDLEGLMNFLRKKGIPADLGEDISRWSVVSLPEGYRERAIRIYSDKLLDVRVLHPQDFIISKLRRFTDEDIKDALLVAKKYSISCQEIEEKAASAIRSSPRDSVVFQFKKQVKIFCEMLERSEGGGAQ